MILVQMSNIFRLLIGVSGLQYGSESYGGKQKHVENDWHLNKHFWGGENGVLRKIRTQLDLLMTLVQMYNIFRLLRGVPDYSRVVSRMEENNNM